MSREVKDKEGRDSSGHTQLRVELRKKRGLDMCNPL